MSNDRKELRTGDLCFVDGCIAEVVDTAPELGIMKVVPRIDIMDNYTKTKRAMPIVAHYMDVAKEDVEPLACNVYGIGAEVESRKGAKFKVTGFEYLTNKVVCLSCRAGESSNHIDRVRYAYSLGDLRISDDMIHFRSGQVYKVHGLFTVEVREDPYHIDKCILYLTGTKYNTVYGVVKRHSSRSELQRKGLSIGALIEERVN